MCINIIELMILQYISNLTNFDVHIVKSQVIIEKEKT